MARPAGETDEFGLPVRYNWAAEYRGATTVVYGHTPVPEAEWLNNTLCIDTGCVFRRQADGAAMAGEGDRLGPARAYAERGVHSASAAGPERRSGRSDDRRRSRPASTAAVAHCRRKHATTISSISTDVIGKRIVTTSAGRTITVPEANAAAALEVMTPVRASTRSG